MMKFVTFNIRCDCGHDGDNNFEFRKPLILEALAAERPDIVCFQEVLPHMAAWLKEHLTDYTVVGCGRGPRLDGEQMTVAYRRERFDLMRMDTFWLSETPCVPGSRYPGQSPCPRTCSELLLHDLCEEKVLRVLNTHLDHVGAEARRRGLEQILRRVDASTLFPDAPVILAGDFNAPPHSAELKVFDAFPGYVNAAEGIGITFHGYMRTETPSCIDYIYLRGAISCLGARKWTQVRNGVFLSDHYPVCAELTLER